MEIVASSCRLLDLINVLVTRKQAAGEELGPDKMHADTQSTEVNVQRPSRIFEAMTNKLGVQSSQEMTNSIDANGLFSHGNAIFSPSRNRDATSSQCLCDEQIESGNRAKKSVDQGCEKGSRA